MNVSSNSVNRGRNKIERRRTIVKNLILQPLNLWFTRVIIFPILLFRVSFGDDKSSPRFDASS